MKIDESATIKSNVGGPIRIGVSLSLSGPLGSNGRTARLAQKIWEEEVNSQGGLLGRRVEIVCRDDQTNADRVKENYAILLESENVDLVVGGYGNLSIAPAMPIVMKRKKYFIGLMGLGVNGQFNYEGYFVMIPTGPNPNTTLTEGFFGLAASQKPNAESVAILAADAEFAKNPIIGAKVNAQRLGLRVVAETLYPLSTSDFSPYLSKLNALNPDVLFLCSYLNDSVGLIKAISVSDLRPKLVGGAMIGPQSGAVKAELGPLLNGIVNYEYWLPVPQMNFPGVATMIAKYQIRAAAEDADPLGHYVGPQAYAQMQVVEQAIRATGGTEDQKLISFTQQNAFQTVVGEVKFGAGGEWASPRVLQVQFQNIVGNGVEQFRTASTQVVVAPESVASGPLIYPYSAAKK
jgi:branched-chain amino acid transport system substrate-binding protein